MLTPEQDRKLARLKNYHTRYEAVVTDGTSTFLLAYVAGRSFRHLVQATQTRVEFVNAVTHAETFVEGRKLVSGKFELRYSGRTQREAILSSEHLYIETAAKHLAQAEVQA